MLRLYVSEESWEGDNRYWITAEDTAESKCYYLREELKKAGFRWHPELKKWHISLKFTDKEAMLKDLLEVESRVSDIAKLDKYSANYAYRDLIKK